MFFFFSRMGHMIKSLPTIICESGKFKTKFSCFLSVWASSLKVPHRDASRRPPVTSLILLELLRNPPAALPAAPHCLLAAGCWTQAEGREDPGRSSDHHVGLSGAGPCHCPCPRSTKSLIHRHRTIVILGKRSTDREREREVVLVELEASPLDFAVLV